MSWSDPERGAGRGPPVAALEAATAMHHALFTGLILAAAGQRGQAAAAALVEDTFRRQHDERFLPGLVRLGLADRPPAVACARYLVLANRAGGLDLEYGEESDSRAWVRYLPPRWAYPGPAICALDDRVSEAFLRGFHARCGESLGVPGLRFVCTGMTTRGDPGLEGYFEDTARELAAHERLAFAFDERPPPGAARALSDLPWPEERAPLARRNYAVRYIELMLPAAVARFGDDTGARLAAHAARRVGIQLYRETAERLAVRDRSVAAFTRYLAAMNAGTGNAVAAVDEARGRVTLARFRLGGEAELRAWSALWSGALAVHDRTLSLEIVDGPGWRIGAAPGGAGAG